MAARALRLNVEKELYLLHDVKAQFDGVLPDPEVERFYTQDKDHILRYFYFYLNSEDDEYLALECDHVDGSYEFIFYRYEDDQWVKTTIDQYETLVDLVIQRKDYDAHNPLMAWSRQINDSSPLAIVDLFNFEFESCEELTSFYPCTDVKPIREAQEADDQHCLEFFRWKCPDKQIFTLKVVKGDMYSIVVYAYQPEYDNWAPMVLSEPEMAKLRSNLDYMTNIDSIGKSTGMSDAFLSMQNRDPDAFNKIFSVMGAVMKSVMGGNE